MKMFPWETRTTSIEQSSAGFQHFGQGFEKPRTTTPFHWETNHWPLDFISFLQWHSPSVVPVSQVKGREKENTLTCSVGWFLWYVYKLSLRPNTNYQHDVTKQGLRRDACDQSGVRTRWLCMSVIRGTKRWEVELTSCVKTSVPAFVASICRYVDPQKKTLSVIS